MIISFDTLILVKGLLLGSICFLAVQAFPIFSGFALKKRRDMVVREAEAEGEAQKRDRMLQAKEKFLQLKTSMRNTSMRRIPKLYREQTESKEMQLSQKIEEQQRTE